MPLDENRFEGSEASNRKVRTSLERHFGGTTPRRHPIFSTGTVGSSDNLVRDPRVIEHWHEASRKIQSIEMEAAGVFEAAARTDTTYPVLVVRGTSDVVGYRREPEWTEYACHTAASFIISLIRSGLLDAIRPLLSRADNAIAAVKEAAAPVEPPPSTLGTLRLTTRFEPMGGPKELRVWIAEVADNVRMKRTPLFRLEFEDEAAILAAYATLDARHDRTVEERDTRLDLLSMARQTAFARMILSRFLSLLFGGFFGRWGPDSHSSYPEVILPTLRLNRGSAEESNEKHDLVCIVGSERAFFLHARVPVNAVEVKSIWENTGLPDPLFLETGKHPADYLPYYFRIGKVLPEILRTWLFNTLSTPDEKLEDEAKRTFRIEDCWFQLEKER